MVAHDVIDDLMADGFYTNLATFPAVPMKHAGVRMTLTLHHTLDDIRALVDALADHVPAALERGGDAAQRRRRATVAGGDGAARCGSSTTASADGLDAAEWDALLGDRGTFTVAGLRFLEHGVRAGGSDRPEDAWDFHYYVVRDRAGARCWPRSSRRAVEGRHAVRAPRCPRSSRSAAPRTRTT